MAKSYGYRSKTLLREEGFVVAKVKILLTSGKVGTEVGRSKVGVVSSNINVLLEDARLNAVSSFLYKNGYSVTKENYESLDMDKVQSAELVDYDIYYTQNQFNSFDSFNTKHGRYIVRRDSKGRIRNRYKETSKVHKKGLQKDFFVRSFK